MSNLLTVLREEVRRIARKEIRTQVGVIRRATAQHRRDIAKLKRQIGVHEKRLESLETGTGKREAAVPRAELPVEETRFSPRSVRAQRRRLKLSAEDFAKLIGVSAQTIYNWELGKVRPREAQLGALVVVRSLGRRAALKRLRGLPDGEATE
jgi:DNA-binding transcriptional regulator YiaG